MNGDSRLKLGAASSLQPGADTRRDNLTEHPLRYDLENTGRFYLVRYEREIEANHARFIEEKLRPTLSTAGPWIDPRFSDFGKTRPISTLITIPYP